MESRDEDLERLLCPPARRTNRGWIIAGVCAALAAAALELGHEVTIVSGPVEVPYLSLIHI